MSILSEQYINVGGTVISYSEGQQDSYFAILIYDNIL